MPDLDLENKYRDFIITTIKQVLPSTEIFVYGSRTQGKAIEYSDVDIALNNNIEIPIENLIKIKSLFNESTFPYKVDIIDLKTVSDSFYKIIENDLYKLI